jgi:hypothetical protein
MTADQAATAPGACFLEIQNPPGSVLSCLLPSRYCESDRFGGLARAVTEHVQPGYDQVRANRDRHPEAIPLAAGTFTGPRGSSPR